MDRLGLTGLVHPLSVVNRLIIRDNIDINIPCQTGELIHQGTAFAAAEMPCDWCGRSQSW